MRRATVLREAQFREVLGNRRFRYYFMHDGSGSAYVTHSHRDVQPVGEGEQHTLEPRQTSRAWGGEPRQALITAVENEGFFENGAVATFGVVMNLQTNEA